MLNSREWIDHIIEVLFAADMRRIDKMISDLVEKNNSIRNENCFGFMHHGKKYINPKYISQKQVLANYPCPTLSLQLYEEARAFDREVKRLVNDEGKIRQALVPLIINCVSLQEVRDCLPDCVVAMMPQLAAIPRHLQDSVAHIRSDRYAMKAYEKALPLMESYSVAALIC